MAVTRLGDLVIASEIFVPAIIQHSLELDAFIQSGVAVPDKDLNDFLGNPNGGNTISPRFIGPLDAEEDNISNDDPADKSTPDGLRGIKNTAVRQSLNKSWSSMDINASIHGSDPLAAVASRIGKFWMTRRQRRAIASMRGVVAANIASDGGDMVVDISGEAGADALFGGLAFIDAQLTLGDRMGELSAIALHSTVYGTAKKKDLIEFRRQSEGAPEIPYYQGLRVITDDAMPRVGDHYHTYLFGPGAIAMGMGNPKVPFEVKRDPEAGHGGGQETVFSRVEMVIHPQGFECSLTSTPTVAQLMATTSWARAWERKRVPFACMITKG